MLSFRRQGICNKGFTLIELVIGIGLIGLLISITFSVFSFTSLVFDKIQVEDDLLLQGRFALEYIREEITERDIVTEALEIISMNDYLPDNFSYLDTLGFFIVKKQGTIYNHIFYRVANNTLYRTDFKSATYLPKDMPNNLASNFVLDNICETKDTYYDKDNKLLCLVIQTKDAKTGKEYRFMETLYLIDDINKRGIN